MSYLTLFTGYKFYKLVFLIPIIITVVGIEVKDSFWERDSSQFYKFGNKIKEYTNINDVIMYANSVPDAWCVTKRKIVQDPAFYKKNTSNRILEEVKRFDVDYLLVDVCVFQAATCLKSESLNLFCLTICVYSRQ